MNNCGPPENKISVTHIVYRLDVGGMENGLVNLINTMDPNRVQHSIICLTHATDFRQRISVPGVRIFELHKQEGKYPKIYAHVYQVLRQVRPDIVHTRNLGALDLAWIALFAGCPVRIHGEHGWDIGDPSGSSLKYRFLRRCCDPMIHQYFAVSKDIHRWLRDVIGIADRKIVQVYNGVDLNLFSESGCRSSLPWSEADRVTFGTVGRQDAIKGLEDFLNALQKLVCRRPDLRDKMGIVMAGDGPEHERCQSMVREYDLGSCVYLPGQVEDVPALLRSFDFFVQPSINEGISNTILEAQSCGLGVVATNVGGNPELIEHGYNGLLVDAGNTESLAGAIESYIDNPETRRKHGDSARSMVKEKFGIGVMSEAYLSVYEAMTRKQRVTGAS